MGELIPQLKGVMISLVLTVTHLQPHLWLLLTSSETARGVNMTLPPLNCQSTPAEAAHLQESLQHLGIQYEVRHSISQNTSAAVALDLELAFTRKQGALAAAIARSCSVNGNARLLRGVGTAFVARDIKQILQALGELDRGLNFYGKSYGTLLGSTFAA